ncbi:TPA: hypothetical protein ACJHGT_004593 [Yersinia enterocolitica]|uniref:hypothetical protein n=1 Tax=Yersinia TaxID=629 RepID=UPI0025AB52C8|nr:hypothetical protein [Yersinia rohdei]HDL6748652.1 hypothetical protein [Yersinia enterocolitica]MDN0094135.1 hypothetical protein [Yersinia rohdei]HDL8095958.1 hypothetical protein [Yersinia enterocolitica]HDL8482821.1 hypothetical protein [Yersinia enterocolitica]HDV7162384.1 hypothetical protein [Yersinia enterocolitica]
MLLTLEMMWSHDLKRTMLTLDELDITYGPELIEAINNYTAKSALTPPGLWTRKYKNHHYLTQSVEALPFFMFLKTYELVPVVGEFLGKNFKFVWPSADNHPDASFNVWIGTPTESESVEIAMQLTA